MVSSVFQVTELECVSSQTTAIKSQKTELNQTIEELEAALRAKEEVGRGEEEMEAAGAGSQYSPLVPPLQELQRLKAEVESANEFQTQKDSLTLKLQVRETRAPASSARPVTGSVLQDTESRNQTLEAQLRELEQRLESSQQERDAFHKSLRSLLQLLDSKILELTELRDTLAKLLQSS